MRESLLKVWALRIGLALVLVFMLAPIAIVIVNSFNTSAYNAWPPEGMTLDWYRRALANPAFRHGAWNSIVIGAVSTLLVLALGILLAYGLVRLRLRGLKALKSLLFGPLVVPRVAIGFALFVLFVSTRSGLYGSYAGIILAHAILMLPFVVAILAASLGEVDPVIEEAARDLGASGLTAFRRATLPQIRGGLAVAGIFAFITSFDEVETTIFLVRPAVNTLPVEMYHYLEQYQDPTLAALSAILILFTFLILLVVPFLVKGRALLRLMGAGRH